MWKLILGIIGGLVTLVIIIKLSTMNSDGGYNDGGIRSSLDSIRNKFDDVCKKIGIRSGC